MPGAAEGDGVSGTGVPADAATEVTAANADAAVAAQLACSLATQAASDGRRGLGGTVGPDVTDTEAPAPGATRLDGDLLAAREPVSAFAPFNEPHRWHFGLWAKLDEQEQTEQAQSEPLPLPPPFAERPLFAEPFAELSRCAEPAVALLPPAC